MKTLLLTPPFTQLNTPYPATMYIKGFLNTLGKESLQLDLGIEVILRLFTKKRLSDIFEVVEQSDVEVSENAYRILSLKEEYIHTIEPVIKFLQNRNSTLAYGIAEGRFLPKAARFKQVGDVDWAFGAMGILDKARHYATLYLQDLSDFIRETVDPFFEFSRYAERLGHSATHFDELNAELQEELTFTDEILLEILEERIAIFQPDLVLVSVPFPGNLYAGFRVAQYIKNNYPNIKISLGGGFPNTELRSLTEPRVFDYFDFVTLDDGERPVQNIIEYLEGKRSVKQLKRTFVRQNDEVLYINGSIERDVPFAQTGTPDYTDIDVTQYLSVLEVTNPMHRLWSDGRWNKLTMAHGCYWKKCSFCDISLEYIGNYEPITAQLICDRMQQQIDTTGETGFHFVDEAAPPALMKEVAIEILKRRMTVTWWANIRFEASFTSDLSRLLSKSGCVAVSGGLEVASNRLLKRMKKGVSVEQVAQVCQGFTEAGILVHAYLMYGFPTQDEQETVDSLEIVRQLFEQGIVQSGFWHLFAMTAHSPVGLNPEEFEVIRTGPELGSFANNDLSHEDPKGADHEIFGEGLRKSLFNYMNGVGFDLDLQSWFDFDVPQTTVLETFILDSITRQASKETNKRVLFLGNKPEIQSYGDGYSLITIEEKTETLQFELTDNIADFLSLMIDNTGVKTTGYKFEEVQDLFVEMTGSSKENLTELEVWKYLRTNCLYLV